MSVTMKLVFIINSTDHNCYFVISLTSHFLQKISPSSSLIGRGQPGDCVDTGLHQNFSSLVYTPKMADETVKISGENEDSKFLPTISTVTNEMHKGAAAEEPLQAGDADDEERGISSSSPALPSTKNPKPPTHPRPVRSKIPVIHPPTHYLAFKIYSLLNFKYFFIFLNVSMI